MAYLDLNSDGGGGGAVGFRAALSVRAAEFSVLECHAIKFGRLDPVSTLHGRGGLRRAIDGVLGLRRANTLADPRLEALRRYVVASVAELPLGPFRSDLAANGVCGRRLDALDLIIGKGN